MPSPSGPFFFDETYREEAALGDGTRVLLRTVLPSDRELLRAGFQELSAESRYMRFFIGKTELSEEEARMLTELDGVCRFALCAVRPEGGQGLGVARFALDNEADEVAEAAITVVDHAQGKGLGTLLLQRLAAAAHERGVRFFRCELLASNRRVRRLLESLEGVVFEADGELLRAQVPVPEAGPSDSPARLDRSSGSYHLLGQSARGAIRVRFRKLLLK
jgi:RimJ/RimL family protein N-acetyltransferase